METILKPGDILHCSGNRLISKLIKLFTKSKVSHTALYIEIWGQPYIIDAQKDGVNVRPFEEWQKKYKYFYIINRNPLLTKEDGEVISKRALSKVGHTAYDLESLLIRQPWKLLTGNWKEAGNKEEKMYCSEFVAWVYEIPDYFKMSPEDLFNWCKLRNYQTL
ncbi:MAG: hypothetical protein RIR01_2358 [Bacteroidota bacterium]|jgi:hypothetical protein